MDNKKVTNIHNNTIWLYVLIDVAHMCSAECSVLLTAAWPKLDITLITQLFYIHFYYKVKQIGNTLDIRCIQILHNIYLFLDLK